MTFTINYGAGGPATVAGPNPCVQALLSSSSAGSPDISVLPHHPITCQSELRFHEDGRFSCEHATAPPGERRTQFCLEHSVAILLIELARHL
jgi:hypothetical protein